MFTKRDRVFLKLAGVGGSDVTSSFKQENFLLEPIEEFHRKNWKFQEFLEIPKNSYITARQTPQPKLFFFVSCQRTLLETPRFVSSSIEIYVANKLRSNISVARWNVNDEF